MKIRIKYNKGIATIGILLFFLVHSANAVTITPSKFTQYPNITEPKILFDIEDINPATATIIPYLENSTSSIEFSYTNESLGQNGTRLKMLLNSSIGIDKQYNLSVSVNNVNYSVSKIFYIPKPLNEWYGRPSAPNNSYLFVDSDVFANALNFTRIANISFKISVNDTLGKAFRVIITKENISISKANNLGSYIFVDTDFENNMNWVYFKIYYNRTIAQLLLLNESTLRPIWFNTTSNKWQNYASFGVNVNGSYVSFNDTHFSIVGIEGESLPTTTTTLPQQQTQPNSGSSSSGSGSLGTQVSSSVVSIIEKPKPKEPVIERRNMTEQEIEQLRNRYNHAIEILRQQYNLFEASQHINTVEDTFSEQPVTTIDVSQQPVKVNNIFEWFIARLLGWKIQ